MSIRDVEDVLSPDDMVIIFEAALIALRTKTTLDKLTDHLDVTDGELASLEARLNFVLYGGDE
jgi:hypothetical protein